MKYLIKINCRTHNDFDTKEQALKWLKYYRNMDPNDSVELYMSNETHIKVEVI